ncbi:MAG: hypothetical protein WC752_03545 [Patescibacteria group bacterium]|jgi:hypothetical protein
MKTSIIKTLLKNKQEIYEYLFHEERWNKLTIKLLLISLFGIAFYGLVMGTYVDEWQHWFKISYKAILLIYGSIILCVPALYVFTSIAGSNHTLKQIVFLLLGALATVGIVFTGFLPIVWFFTFCTKDIVFIRVMHGAIIFLSLSFGLFYFQQGMNYQPDKIKKHGYFGVLFLWMLVFSAVLLQMAIKLSPWFNSFKGWW